MNVGVRCGEGEPTRLALPAWPRLGTFADQSLPEPEREPLLADTAWTVKQQRSGQRVTPGGLVEAGTERRMAVEGEEGHDGT